MPKGNLRRKDYYRIETVRIILFPVFLLLVTAFFINQGWVTEEQAGIVWNVILIQVVASLLVIGVYYLFTEKK